MPGAAIYFKTLERERSLLHIASATAQVERALNSRLAVSASSETVGRGRSRQKPTPCRWAALHP